MAFQASDHEPKFYAGGDDDDYDDDVHVTFTTNSEATKLVSYEDSYDDDEDELPLSLILPEKVSCLRKCRDETVKKRPPCNSFHNSVKKSKVKHSVVDDEEEEDDTLTSRGFKKKRELADKPFSMIQIKNFVKQQLASVEESIEECHRKEQVEEKRLLSLKRDISKYSKELANKKIQVRCVREINRIFKKLLVNIEERSMELVVKEAQLCLMEDLIGEQKLELKKKEVELQQIKSKENEFRRVMENIDKDCERKEEELRVVSFKVAECTKELRIKEKELDAMKELIGGHAEKLESMKKQYEGQVREHESMKKQFEGQVREHESKLKHFEEQVKELKFRDKKLEGGMEELKSKKKIFEGLVKEFESKEREFQGQKEELKSEKMCFESRVKEFESKEKQLDGRMKDFESRKGEFEGKVKEYESKEEEFESRKREFKSEKMQLESRVKELKSKENELGARIKEFESKKGEFEGQVNDLESQKKNLESQVKNLESKENQLEGRIKESESKKGEFEGQVNDLESQNKNLESQVKDLKSKENQLEGRIKEFEIKNGELEGQVNDLESQKKNLESRVKELESKNKYFESRVTELESKEREFEKRVKELKSDEQQLQGRVMELKPKNRHSESRAENFKIKEKELEGWEKPLIKSFKEEESGDQLSPIIEENSLKLVLVPNETECFGNDILDNLLASPDPSEVVLEIIQNPIVPRCREGHNTVTIESGHIALLVQLMRISPHIQPHVREEAMKLALDLKAHMSENSQAVLGFLLILSIYGLLPSFNKAEVFKLFGFVAQHKIAVELFETLGFADKISDFIQNLIREEQHIAAVRFICAYDLIDNFQPFSLLREHMQNVKLISESSCKNTNSIEIKDKARDEEIASLKTVLDCISDNNLQSEHLLKEIQFRSFELFEQKGK